tara:strand:- start:494 stop:892 length:399 start_codon:yes stop_codon:yes gene_type:complete
MSRKEEYMSNTRWADKADLFYYPPCDVPAWYPLVDEMIELIEEWNEHEEQKMRFFQIKEKFGTLVAYIQPVGDGVVDTPRHLQDAINKIANEGIKICRKCGERKVQTVIESRLQWRCLDHWDDESRWRVIEC